jgi:hypothetical protein
MSAKRFMMGPHLLAKLNWEEAVRDVACPDRDLAYRPNDVPAGLPAQEEGRVL